MPNGFFLGGAADGMAESRRLGISERGQEIDAGLRSRGLDIQQQAENRVGNQSMLERADKLIADTMAQVGTIIKETTTLGKDPAAIQKAVMPLVESAKQIAAKVGRDPSALDASVQAQLFSPNAIETAAVAGAADATKQMSTDRTLAAGGTDPNVTRWKDPKDKVSAENSLRDDYAKQSAPFITIRDAKNRLDNIEQTGAGDISLLFQFMKILDPGSTVREGEFATAGSVAGVPGQIEGLRRQIVGGGRLSDAARNQIISQANKLYQAQAVQHDKLTTKFATIAKSQGLRPDNVVIDLWPSTKQETESFSTRFQGTGGAATAVPAPPAGFNIVR